MPGHESKAETLALGRPAMAPMVLYLLAAILAVGIAWSHMTPVDVFVRAPGVVRPDGEVVQVVTEVSGRVRLVRAREGAEVQAGDVLLQIDTDAHRLRREALSEQIAVREAQLDQLRQKLRSLLEIHRAELDRIDLEAQSERRRLDREATTFSSAVESAEIRMNQARKEHETSVALFDRGLVSRNTMEQSLAALRLAELDYSRAGAGSPDPSGLALLEAARKIADADGAAKRTELEGLIFPLQLELAELRQQVRFESQEEEKATVRSPARGYLAFVERIHPGEYLSSGDPVATLEPGPRRRVVEAVLANRDAEDVHAGQAVRLLLDDSEVLGGQVRWISPDAVRTDPAAGSYRVTIEADTADLRLGQAMEVRFVTRTESLLGLIAGRITRSFHRLGE